MDALAQSDIALVADIARMHLIDVAQRYSASFDADVPPASEPAAGGK